MGWVSGFHSVRNILRKSPERVKELHLKIGRANDRFGEIEVLADKHGIIIHRSHHQQMEKRFGKSHQGIAIRCKDVEVFDEKFLMSLIKNVGEKGFFLMLDGVTDPRNLGACLRSAECAGVDAVIVPRNKSVGMTPSVVKVASGAADLVPLVTVTNISRTILRMQELGVWVFGASLDTQNSIYECDFCGPSMLVLGSEAKGMKKSTRDKCDYVGNIPMMGELNSLNVSVAAGVILFEALRQRLQKRLI